LRQAKRVLKRIFEASPLGIAITVDGKFVYCNHKQSDLFGLESPMELCGRRIEEFLDGEEFSAVSELENFIKIIRADGKPVTLEIYATEFPFEREAGILSFCANVSERVAAQQALAESEAWHRDLAENASDIIQSVRPDGSFMYVNRPWRETLGYSKREVKNVTLWDVIHSDSQAHCMEVFKKAISGEEVKSAEAVLVTKQGKKILVEGNVTCNIKDGIPISTRGVFRDITDRRAAEEEQRKKNVELEYFANAVSHDLKSSIAAILLANETVRTLFSGEIPEGKRALFDEILEMIDQSAGRCGRLIDDVYAISELGRTPVAVEEVDVGEIVSDILSENKSEINARGISVEVSPVLGAVEANRTYIYQIFGNLIGNAIKHNESAAPHVEISRLPDQPDGRVWFLVRDNGAGISQGEIDNIFVPFYKGEDAGKTGIGLAIVEKIVRLYNGEIRAYNNGGACFEFTLSSDSV